MNLQYFLTTRSFPAEKIYETSLPAFDPPADPIDYYKWAWEVLFGDEPYELESLEGYVENNDRSMAGRRPLIEWVEEDDDS